MDVLSAFISVILIDSSTGSLVRLDVNPGRAWSSSPTCIWTLFLALSLSPGNSLVSSWCDRSKLMLAFLL